MLVSFEEVFYQCILHSLIRFKEKYLGLWGIQHQTELNGFHQQIWSGTLQSPDRSPDLRNLAQIYLEKHARGTHH